MTSDSGHVFAPLGRRVCAWLFDAGLGVLLAAGFVKVTGGEHDLSTIWHLLAFKSVGGQTGHDLSAAMNPTSPQLSVLKPILGLLVILTVITLATVAYRVVTIAKWGAGPGKVLLGLRVVVDHPDPADQAEAEAPGWARSWKRWAVPLAPGLLPLPATGLLAYLPAFRDHRRRGLHDRAAGTIVVDVRTRPAPPRPQVLAPASDEFYVTMTAPSVESASMIRSTGATAVPSRSFDALRNA
jgi:uncharacterized RDD family membrane protein YckC